MQFNFDGKVISYDFRLNKEATGHEVRDFLVDAQNLFGTVNELSDMYAYRYELSKLTEEEIEETLKDEVSKTPFVTKGRKIVVDRNKKVTTFSGSSLTLNQAKKETVDNKYLYQRFKSILDELKSAINVSTRILYWDSVDMKNSD